MICGFSGSMCQPGVFEFDVQMAPALSKSISRVYVTREGIGKIVNVSVFRSNRISVSEFVLSPCRAGSSAAEAGNPEVAFESTRNRRGAENAVSKTS
jgi:hypothetical protein